MFINAELIPTTKEICLKEYKADFDDTTNGAILKIKIPRHLKEKYPFVTQHSFQKIEKMEHLEIGLARSVYIRGPQVIFPTMSKTIDFVSPPTLIPSPTIGPKKAHPQFLGPMLIPYWIITALSLAFIGFAILSGVWMLAVGGIGLLATILAALRDIRER